MLKEIEFRNIDVDSIKFKKGVNLILGDKINSDSTNNSVGKTLLIEIINHLLGARRKKIFDFRELKNVSVVGTFEFLNKEIVVERFLVSDSDMKKNNIKVLVNNFDEINEGETGYISEKEWLNFLQFVYVPSKFMSYRSFNSMFFRNMDIEDFDIAIKEYPTNNNWERGKYNSYFLDLGYEIIASTGYYTNKEKAVLKKISPTLQKIIDHENEEIIDIQDEFISLSLKLRKLYDENRLIRSQIEILNNNLTEIDNISSEDFKQRFTVYEYELREFIIKNYNETKKFHDTLINDNKFIMELEKKNLEQSLFNNNTKITEYTQKKKTIEEKIKEYEGRDIYVNATRELLSKFLAKQNVDELINNADAILKDETTSELRAYLEEESDKIYKYKQFLLINTKKLYPDVDDVDLEIFINNHGAFDINFNFKGTKGEGKGTIRTLLYIFLLIDINKGQNIDYLILDSKVIDAIDIDVLNSFLTMIDEYSKSRDIQVICAGNKQNFIPDNTFYKAVVLTPQNPLFNMELHDE